LSACRTGEPLGITSNDGQRRAGYERGLAGESFRLRPDVSAGPFGTMPVRALRSSLRLQVRLDEPEPLVDAARDLGEQVGRVQVAQFIGLIDGLPRPFAERRQGR